MLGEIHTEPAQPSECTQQAELSQAGSSQQHATHKRLVRLIPVENQWSADEMTDGGMIGATEQHLTKARRYSIDPKDMLRSQKQAREQGLKIIGIYHSHPDHVAVPSECDRIQAWATYAYVIVSVCEGKAVDVQNWTLDSEHQFQPELMDLLPQRMTDKITERMPARQRVTSRISQVIFL